MSVSKKINSSFHINNKSACNSVPDIPLVSNSIFFKIQTDIIEHSGIRRGDIIEIDLTKTPSAGDIIIVELGNDLLIRYFEKTGNTIHLYTDAGKLSPIKIENDAVGFKIIGVFCRIFKADLLK